MFIFNLVTTEHANLVTTEHALETTYLNLEIVKCLTRCLVCCGSHWNFALICSINLYVLNNDYNYDYDWLNITFLTGFLSLNVVVRNLC